MIRWFRASLIALLSVGMMAATTALPATAATTHRLPPIYLALGDSIAAGVGASSASTGYVDLLAEILRKRAACGPGHSGQVARPRTGCQFLQLQNISKGGAKTQDLIESQLPTAIELLRDRNWNSNPYDDVRFITITIGGNDVFEPVVGACIIAPSPDPANCEDIVRKELDEFEANLDKILGKLRSVARKHTVIVATAYNNPLSACQLGQVPGAVALGDRVLEDNSLPGLNDRVRSVAGRYDVKVANAYGKLTNSQLVGGTDCLHPNQAGHQAYAEIFAKTILASR